MYLVMLSMSIRLTRVGLVPVNVIRSRLNIQHKKDGTWVKKILVTHRKIRSHHFTEHATYFKIIDCE